MTYNALNQPKLNQRNINTALLLLESIKASTANPEFHCEPQKIEVEPKHIYNTSANLINTCYRNSNISNQEFRFNGNTGLSVKIGQDNYLNQNRLVLGFPINNFNINTTNNFFPPNYYSMIPNKTNKPNFKNNNGMFSKNHYDESNIKTLNKQKNNHIEPKYINANFQPTAVNELTGSGKTALLNSLEYLIDQLTEESDAETKEVSEEYEIDLLSPTKNMLKTPLKTKTMNNKKRRKIKKYGDWYCNKCNNLNYGFRDACNICKTHKIESQFMESKQIDIEILFNTDDNKKVCDIQGKVA